ncbi:hypothetical protein WICPIJ_007857 [Wickerhamomyces pijperi]|uniref:Anaphase-promoting complex subunit 1 n=1 Tax=Wickerhamomyces pijperi TaxID=599730 RepID=A0A9P8Q0V0_WICPI|nr:hypothetical protein WICPIJ_007857 [Wickerhamomyces pijperi]
MEEGSPLRWILKDLKLSPSLAKPFKTHSIEDVRVVSSDSGDCLVISEKILYWYKGDILCRKLLYPTKILNSFFSRFKNDTHRRALVVLLEDSSHIYYDNGKSYTLSFPFKALNGFPCLNGMIVQREELAGSNNISFFTVLEPMAEFGTVVSSTTSSISSDERLVFFPNSGASSISLTYNENEGKLSFYHTRFLNRQSEDKPITEHIQPQNDQSHRRKASRKPSGTIGSINQEDKMVDDDSNFLEAGKRRGASYSETLSIDRMASYDFFNNNAKLSDSGSNINSPSSSFDPLVLRKDCILGGIFTATCSIDMKDYKVHPLSFEGTREAFIIKSKGFMMVFIFENGNPSLSPKLLKSIDLSQDYEDFALLDDLPEFILLVDKNSCDLKIFNPLLSMELSVFQSSTKIKQIISSYKSDITFRNVSDDVLQLRLCLKPGSQVLGSLIDSLKYLTNSYSFNYIKIIWIYSFMISKREWDSFLLTIVALILPAKIKEGHLDACNPVVKALTKIKPIQQKLAQDQFSLYQLAPNIILALHLICEDMKLNVLNKGNMRDLRMLIYQLLTWCGWNGNWTSYYADFFSHDNFKASSLLKFSVPQILQTPPDLLKSLNSLFEEDIVPYLTFSQLAQESETIEESVTPRSFYILRLFEAIVSADFNPVDVVAMMVEFNISLNDLETYPIGVLIPLKESIVFCQRNIGFLEPLLDTKLYELIDRKDLSESTECNKRHDHKEKTSVNLSNSTQHSQTKDIHQIVNAINEVQESIAPLEHDRFQITKLIFNEDRRFYEISSMLQTFKTQVVFYNKLSDLTESSSLYQRKKLASLVALRTLTIPLGRSIMLYSSKEPLVTEKFPIPKLTFSVQIQPDNINVSSERDFIIQNCLDWGDFHNGAAAALSISKSSKGISGSWIVFNKPAVLNAQHGGFLLGLGLNGHMKDLEEWNIYNYLGPKHVYTSIGLLLGMSASLIGTMDVKLTKVLSVHTVALLPHGSSDLIVNPSVQTAGLIGIGLLYLETQHRRMSEILLSQINGAILVDDRNIADESYRMAAGISLGYINLGKGDDLKGLNDTHVVDKLLAIAITLKDVQTSESFDKSMSGALMALMFIYLKTNNETIAKKIQIPDTDQLLDYFRPDILLLRVLTRNMIMWDSIGNTIEWVDSHIPENLSHSDRLTDINLHNIIGGLCLSISLKYSSTGDLTARDTVLSFYDKLNTLATTYHAEGNFDSKVIQNSLSRVRVILGIGLSLIMASTGDLETFKRLRIIHGTFNTKDESNNTLYGEFMGINMALGFLFMAGGQFGFKTNSNFAIAALITSVYPIFPKTDDTFQPQVHLQALRHFWCLAVQERCIVIRDVVSKKPLTAKIKLLMKDGESKVLTTPSLLPDFELIKEIRLVDSKEYFKLRISNMDILAKNGFNAYVYKKGEHKPIQKAIELMLGEINRTFKQSSTDKETSSFLDLKVFNGFVKEELQGLLNPVSNNQVSSNYSGLSLPSYSASDSLLPNIIDKQIELNLLVSNIRTVDDLWNLKLIFSYYDKLLGDGDIYYLNSEYIETLKIKLWQAMRN